MCEFESKEEMETTLSEISQRVCQCNILGISWIAFIGCLLEAKKIITPKEHGFIKDIIEAGESGV